MRIDDLDLAALRSAQTQAEKRMITPPYARAEIMFARTCISVPEMVAAGRDVGNPDGMAGRETMKVLREDCG